MNGISRVSLTLSLAIGLTACGGGGGGTGSPTATTVIADEDPLAITQEVAQTNETAQGLVIGFGGGIISADGAATETTLSPGTIAAALVRREAENRALNAAQAAVLQNCSSGGTVDVNETQDSISFQFTDCQGYSEFPVPGILNGGIVININSANQNGSTITATFSFSINNFSVDFNDDFSVADGDFNGSLTFSDQFLEVELSTNRYSNTTDAGESVITNYNVSVRIDDISIEDFSGSLNGTGFAGRVNFRTDPPLRFDTFALQYTSGKLIIEGADGSSIEVTANGTNFPAVDIDEDGDGTIDLQPTWSWDEIFGLITV